MTQKERDDLTEYLYESFCKLSNNEQIERMPTQRQSTLFNADVYKTGMGEGHLTVRAGAAAHKQCPSLGFNKW